MHDSGEAEGNRKQGRKSRTLKGTAHEWSADEAREAGRKGGQVSHGGGRQSKN